MRAITPKQIDDKLYRTGMLYDLNNYLGKLYGDFAKTTSTWKHNVMFEQKLVVRPDRIEVTVYTTDPIYGYVNYGTRPHPIYPRNARVLAFPSAFTPKTRPNVIGSGPGGSGGPTVFAAHVNHPGTKPRNFDKIIKAKHEPLFYEAIRKSIQNTAKRWGHTI